MRLDKNLILKVFVYFCVVEFTLKPIQCKKKTLIVTVFVNIKLAEIQNLEKLHRSVERYNITKI